MAATTPVLSLLLILISFSLLHHLPYLFNTKKPLKPCNFNAIYQLGDSLSHTGILIIQNTASRFARLPYGQTFFKKPTGRCSNGLLMIDYIAFAAGLRFLDPYMNKDAHFSKVLGVNFAVGSTALPIDVLAEMNISSPLTNSSLSIQLEWMIPISIQSVSVLEIGGNDYSYAILQGQKTIKEATSMVPQVVQAIKDALKKVLGYGAFRVVVPGNFPIYLTNFQTNDSSAYDEYHCLKKLNELSIYQNDHLKKAIDELKQEHPNVTIIYGDYYNAFMRLLCQASNLGFDASSLQKSCCGIGGDYNYDRAKPCGASGVPVCSNPDQHIIWNGVHLTQKAYHYISYWLIQDFLMQLRCGI